jgi:hypothetical protein
VLRFNFRGVNLSGGEYGHGIGELADARTALAWLRARYPELPFTLAGFSFGSVIALKLAALVEAPSRVIAAGMPTSYQDYSFLWTGRLRRIFIQSTHDEYGPRHELEALLATLSDHPEVHWIEARDHFFTGALDKLGHAVEGLAV